jgi:four helix bundle protein
MKSRSFRDLRVWQEAVDLAVDLYRITDTFPASERYGLTAQIRRAAISIPSNVAEGEGRRGTREWLHFLCVARASLYELETQLEVSGRVGYLSADSRQDLQQRIRKVSGYLNGLMKHVSRLAHGATGRPDDRTT